MVLDIANTRMKDFLDLWILAQNQTFSGTVLTEAIEATFRRRRTPLPHTTPVALTPAFHSSSEKRAQWRAYLRKGRVEGAQPTLPAVAAEIEAFVMPVVRALDAETSFTPIWSPGGPWKPHPQ